MTGDNGLIGGVPNLGGEWPIEFDRAAAKAETPGPGREALGAAPARGVALPPCEAAVLGVGICLTVGVPCPCEGTGEARRAVDACRGTEPLIERPLGEPGDADMGTGSTFEAPEVARECDIV